MMVGRSVEEQYPHIPHSRGKVVLELNGLVGKILPRGASLDLHGGEILGIAGIVGSGRTEMLRAIYGLDAVRSGTVKVHTVLNAATPSGRIEQGVGFLSEDRKEEGLALEQSLAENLTLSRLSPYGSFGLLNRSRVRAAASTFLEKLNVRHRDPDQAVGELSGGNQQKVALARLTAHESLP